MSASVCVQRIFSRTSGIALTLNQPAIFAGYALYMLLNPFSISLHGSKELLRQNSSSNAAEVSLTFLNPKLIRLTFQRESTSFHAASMNFRADSNQILFYMFSLSSST